MIAHRRRLGLRRSGHTNISRLLEGNIPTSFDPIDFIEHNGVVLESAKGPVPNLAEALTGAPIRGGWWAHPASKKIFRATRLARDDDRVLVCRLVGGRVTYVHRRIWPAIVRLARYFDKAYLAAIREEHSVSGEHQLRVIPFPKWVPSSVRKRANDLSMTKALSQLGDRAGALGTQRGPLKTLFSSSARIPRPATGKRSKYANKDDSTNDRV